MDQAMWRGWGEGRVHLTRNHEKDDIMQGDNVPGVCVEWFISEGCETKEYHDNNNV